MASGFDAAHCGHVEIHDDDVGGQLADVRDGLPAGPRLADDRETLLLKQVPESRPEKVVVVDEQHAKCLSPTFRSRLHELSQRDPPFRGASLAREAKSCAFRPEKRTAPTGDAVSRRLRAEGTLGLCGFECSVLSRASRLCVLARWFAAS